MFVPQQYGQNKPRRKFYKRQHPRKNKRQNYRIKIPNAKKPFLDLKRHVRKYKPDRITSP
jgi:hypothetical protein